MKYTYIYRTVTLKGGGCPMTADTRANGAAAFRQGVRPTKVGAAAPAQAGPSLQPATANPSAMLPPAVLATTKRHRHLMTTKPTTDKAVPVACIPQQNLLAPHCINLHGS